jgi:hypothetical protein
MFLWMAWKQTVKQQSYTAAGHPITRIDVFAFRVQRVKHICESNLRSSKHRKLSRRVQLRSGTR